MSLYAGIESNQDKDPSGGLSSDQICKHAFIQHYRCINKSMLPLRPQRVMDLFAKILSRLDHSSAPFSYFMCLLALF